jgi:hypothetical protein
MRKSVCGLLLAVAMSVILIPLWADSSPPQQAADDAQPAKAASTGADTCALWPIDESGGGGWLYYAEWTPHDGTTCDYNAIEPAYLDGLYLWPEDCHPCNQNCETEGCPATTSNQQIPGQPRPFPGLPGRVGYEHDPLEASGIGAPFVDEVEITGRTRPIRFEGRHRQFICCKIVLKPRSDQDPKTLWLAKEYVGPPGDIPVQYGDFEAINERGAVIPKGPNANPDAPLSHVYRGTINGQKYLVLLAQ